MTSSLVKLREAHKDNFEIVLVSLDQSQDEQNKYMQKSGMKNPAFKNATFDEKDAKALGIKQFAMPMVIVVSPEGKVLTGNAASEVYTNAEKAYKSWTTKKD